MKNFISLRTHQLLITMCFLFSTGALMAQTSVQDFGSGTGTFSSKTGSSSFIPNPTSGTTYVRCADASVSINLENTGNPLGTTGSFLKAQAYSSGGVTKASPILNYTAGTEFYTSFTILFGDASAGSTASSGEWYFFQGDGASFGDNNGFTGNQVFLGFKYTFSSGGVVNMDYRNGSSWTSTGTPLSQGTVYKFEIVGNNGSSTINYNYSGSPASLNTNKFDLYLNGVQIGSGLSKGQLANNASIKSSMFYGISSTGSVAHIFVDDVIIYNSVPVNIGAIPAPVVNAPGSTLAGNYGTAFSYFVDATNSPTSYAVESGSLPAGISLNPTTGELFGTPTETGFFSVDISATNGGGTSPAVTHDFQIDMGNQTISFGSLAGAVYGDPNITLTATASSGLPITYFSNNPFVATVSGDQVTIVGAGTATITATQDGDVNYNAAADVAHDLVVAKASQTITFGALSDKLTSDAPFTLTATASSGLPVSYSSSDNSVISISGNTATVEGVGIATITASQVGNDNYEAAADVYQDQLVADANKTDQTITFGALSNATYGDAAISLSATASSGLQVSYLSSDNSVATVSGNTLTIVGVGTATITASQDGDNTYNPAPNVDQSITIDAKGLSLSGLVANDKIYDGNTNATLDESGASLVGVVGLEDVSYSVSGTFASADAGTGITVNLVANLSGVDAGNYFYSGPATLSANINKAPQTITFGALSNKNTNDVPFALTATSSSGLTISYSSSNPAVATVSGDVVTVVGAGTTMITASQAGDNNYDAATPVDQGLLVLLAPDVVMWDFGTATADKNPTSGVPVTNLSFSSVEQGNNYNTSQTITQVNTTSKSTPAPPFSGNYNVSSTAYNGNTGLDLNVNAYFEFTLTPANGYQVSLSSLVTGTRSTATGPKTLGVVTSADGFASTIGTVDVSGNGTNWVKEDFNISTVTSSSPLSVRIYGYDGTGTVVTNSSANNWRLDDLTIEVQVEALPGCSGTPDAGTIASNDGYSICAGGNVNLEASNQSSLSEDGISYQWYSSLDNNSFSPVPSANAATLNTGSLSQTTYYYFEVTCSHSAQSAVSNTISIVVNQAPAKPEISGSHSVCNNSTTSLTSTLAPVGGSYQWYDGANPVGTNTSTYDAGAGNYSVVITSQEGCVSEASDGFVVTESGAISAPIVDGIVNVCPYVGTNEQLTYTVTPDANVQSYTWVVPPTVNIINGQGTGTLVITLEPGFTAAANKQLRVTAHGCGESLMSIFYLLAQAPGTPSTISGPANACDFIDSQNEATYSIVPVPAAMGYNWTFPVGVTLNSYEDNGATAKVSFTNSFVSSSISVRAINACGTSAARSINVMRISPSVPGLITGPNNACMYMPTPNNPAGVNATYSVANYPSATSFVWTLPTGVNLINQSNNGAEDEILVSFTSAYVGGNIAVKAVNNCGESALRSFTIAMNRPGATGAIDIVANQEDCPNRSFTYSIPAIPSNTAELLWSVPTGADITLGQGTVSIDVTYDDNSIVGDVSVVAVNGCGQSAIRKVKIKLPECVYDIRTPLTVISGVETEILEAGIFPNPSSSDFRLRVKGTTSEKMVIRVYDLSGRTVEVIKANPGETITFGNHLKPGTYMVEVINGTQRKVSRIVKL
ncbi:MAG: T9SS type A sorting domain-containing protein [Ferruginibacter sp.]|nr:T9SS type A sorting domain-containing protein [Ferruginibacter sp.]